MAFCIVMPVSADSQESASDYDTLTEALVNVDENGTVDITSEITLEADITIDSGKTFTIDLCGNTIETNGFEIDIDNSSNVTITNGTLNNSKLPTGTLSSRDLKQILYVKAGSNLSLNGVSLNTIASQALVVGGQATLVETNIISTADDVTNDNIITDGYYLSDTSSLLYVNDNASLNYVSGTLDASEFFYEAENNNTFMLYGIYAKGGSEVVLGNEDTHEGPTMITSYACVGFNNTTSNPEITLTIHGGNYTSIFPDVYKFNSVVYLSGRSNVKVTGGTFNAAEKGTVFSIPYTNSTIDLELSGGTFNANETGPSNIIHTYGENASSYVGDNNNLSITGGEYNTNSQNNTLFEFNANDAKTSFISGGTFSDDSALTYLANDSLTVAKVTDNNDDTAYAIGNDSIKESIADATKVIITQGSIDLTNVPDGIEVSNTGNGEVTVNDQEVTDEPVVTHTHEWVLDSTNFADDHSKADFLFVCSKDETHNQTLTDNELDVTRVEATTEEDGKVEYKASVVFEGKTYDATDTVTIAKLPVITSKDDQSFTLGSKGTLTFTSDADYDNFLKVLVDNKELAKENYTVKEGSTVVTLSNEYLNTLSAGTHELSIVSNNGTATTTFKIIKGADPEIVVPETGINDTVMPVAIGSIILAFGAVSLVILKKRYSK